MRGLSPLVTANGDRTSPLRVCVGTLPGSSISSSPRVVSLGHSCTSSTSLHGGCAAVKTRRRVIPSRSTGGAVGSVDGSLGIVAATVIVVVYPNAVRSRIADVVGHGDRLARIIHIRGVPIAGTIRNRSPDGHSQYKGPCITGSVPISDRRRRGFVDFHVRHVVNRTAGRDLIDRGGNGTHCFPGSVDAAGHEPNALKTKVVEIANFDDLAVRINRVGELRGFDRLELWLTLIIDFYRGSCLRLVHDCECGNLGHHHGFACFVGARDIRQNVSCGTIRGDAREVGGEFVASK